jgi:outer membrane protein OmpA-like peptidoglycan-associated protein
VKHSFLVRGFFQKRGFENRQDLKRNEIAELPSSLPGNRLTFPAAKIFDKSDSAKLKNSKTLDDVGKILEQNSYGFAVVACYADLKGDSDKQRELTQARAVNARDYLVGHFKLDDTRIKTFGAGKSADAPDGGLVEVLIYPVGKPAPKPRQK